MKKNMLKQLDKKSDARGVTLIALVVTIIVLLILAGVAISMLRGENGIIKQAQKANEATTDKGAEEKVGLSVSAARAKGMGVLTIANLREEVENSYGGTVTGEEFPVIVTIDGKAFSVTTDGGVTSTKGISLNKSSLTLELQDGATVTETLTASLSDITGEITWSNSDESKATISATTGESITVTAKAVGSTTITATCGSYTAACKVTVKEAIAIGSYVQYDIPYKDMYTDQEYTATNGWRYLGKDDSGNQLIVSTGIPAILYYKSNNNIGNKADGGENSWWATKKEIGETTDTLYQTTKGYDYNKDSGEPNKYAAFGMRYNFRSIPFSYQESETEVSTANTGIFRKVGNTISGTNINLNFEANGVEVVDVHNLTLAELNRATNKASGTSREDTNQDSGYQDLTGAAKGLFDMQKLDGYTDHYYYWLASPYAGERDSVCAVLNLVYEGISGSGSVNGDFLYLGVRPVVTLKPNVQLTVVNQKNV